MTRSVTQLATSTPITRTTFIRLTCATSLPAPPAKCPASRGPLQEALARQKPILTVTTGLITRTQHLTWTTGSLAHHRLSMGLQSTQPLALRVPSSWQQPPLMSTEEEVDTTQRCLRPQTAIPGRRQEASLPCTVQRISGLRRSGQSFIFFVSLVIYSQINDSLSGKCFSLSFFPEILSSPSRTLEGLL